MSTPQFKILLDRARDAKRGIMTAMTYIQPLLPILLICLLAAVLHARRCKKSLLPILAVVVLALLSWPPVDWLLSRPLETRYPLQPLPSQPTQAIVVLSSAIDPPIRERPFPLPDKDTYQRCRFAAWLHTNWEHLPVLACGGPGLTSQQPLSATMRRLLVEAGVPEAMVWTETRSRSTHENAVFASEILRQHGIARIALVVEAQSMPRAEACFRKEGLIVVPAPCDFRQFGSPLEELMPSWKSVQRNETTLHEALGLAWYRLRGWI